MSRVIAALCRHGIYEQPDGVPSAHLPHPLTQEGRAQAAAFADELVTLCETRGWTLCPVLDSSPLLRAFETASVASEALSKRLDRPFSVEEFAALTERCVGAAANLTVDAIEAIVTRDPRFATPPAGWKSSSDYRLPFVGAESLLEAGARCADHLRMRTEPLREAPDDDTILKVFVGHGAAFRHAAVHVGALALEDLPRLSMHHARPVCLATRETSPWNTVAGAWKLRGQQAGAQSQHPSGRLSDDSQEQPATDAADPAVDAEPFD